MKDYHMVFVSGEGLELRQKKQCTCNNRWDVFYVEYLGESGT